MIAKKKKREGFKRPKPYSKFSIKLFLLLISLIVGGCSLFLLVATGVYGGGRIRYSLTQDSWSTDSSSLRFRAQTPRVNNFLINHDGTGLQRIETDLNTNATDVISPRTQLRRMDAEALYGDISYFVVAPNGEWIAIAGGFGDSSFLHIVDATTGERIATVDNQAVFRMNLPALIPLAQIIFLISLGSVFVFILIELFEQQFRSILFVIFFIILYSPCYFTAWVFYQGGWVG